MKEQQNGYCICFNEWALDKEIKNELGLLLIISSLCAEKGYCYANNKYFSQLFEIDECSVSRKLKLLEDKGYITIEYNKTGNIITSREIRLTKISTTIDKNVNGAIDKNVKDNNIKSFNNINNNKRNIKEKEYEEEFEQLWKIYPKKDGKKKALEYYIKARKNKTTYENVLNGINRYNEYIKHEKTQLRYVKNGSSWFNQQCWNDEYKIEKSFLEQLDEDMKMNGEI